MPKVIHPLGLILHLGDIINGIFGETVSGIKLVFLGEREVSDVILFEGDLLDGSGF